MTKVAATATTVSVSLCKRRVYSKKSVGKPDWPMESCAAGGVSRIGILRGRGCRRCRPRNPVVGLARPADGGRAQRGCRLGHRPWTEKYQEVQRIITEDAPYIFLFYNKSWSGQNNRVQGIQPTALGIGWNYEDWYIEEAVVD